MSKRWRRSHRTRAVGAALPVLAGALFTGCRPPEPAVEPSGPLPSVPVYEITAATEVAAPRMGPSRSRDPLADVPRTRLVTLTTSNADARTLLLWMAQQADVPLVVSDEVKARVSVSFRDVPVADAMRAIAAEAGLSFLVSDAEPPWPAVVFFHLPMNVNLATPEAIVARFGVSMEMARFIVQSRFK